MCALWRCSVKLSVTVRLTLQLLAEHGEEDGEVDGAAGLLDHGFQLLILHVQLACDCERINVSSD